MHHNVLVLCEMKDCKYNLHDPNQGEAYQYQCGNDEIEIGAFSEMTHLPECYSYEIEEKK